MEPTSKLLAELRREEIKDARQMSFAQKFLAGAQLFDYACQISRSGIRMQNPTFDEVDVNRELRRRLAIGRHFEELE